jgi:PAS domain S-box-containing protein
VAERILIVDDDPATREGLAMLLGTLGYRVMAAPDGPTALAALRAEPPDVLLLDLILPGDMSGIQLLQNARQVAPNVGAIVMTGYPSAETTVEALRLGAFDYLTKPFDLGRMSGLLTQLVGRLRQERQAAETLRQLDTISRCNRVGIYTLNLAGMFSCWGCAGLLGYAAEDMVGRQTPSVFVDSPGYDLREELDACRREGSTLREHQVRRKDGTRLSLRTKLVLLVDSRRQPIGYAGYLLDVSEERRQQTTQQERILEMERRLADQARLAETLRTLGQAARNAVRLPDLVSLALAGALRLVPSARFAWCFLRDGKEEGLPAVPVDEERVVYLGGAAHSRPELQRSAAALCDAGACGGIRALAGLEPPQVRPGVVSCRRLEALGEAAIDGSPCHVSLPLVFRGETIGLMNVANEGYVPFTPHESEQLALLADEFAVAVAVVRLAVKADEVSRQLQETQGRTARTERLRAVGELASGVAHDFNNLLTAILGSAELLLREEVDPARLEPLRTIRRAAEDGAETVRRILEYTRVQQDRPLTRVDVAEIIREAVELTRGRWRNAVQARGVTVDVQLDLESVPPVLGNPAELRETMTNLILNAVDAMPLGGRLTLVTRAAGDGGACRTVEIGVEDTGTGMAPEVLARVFDPFFTTKEGSGAGLGLAVAHGIVQRHGGEITARSVLGQGTTFTIHLPAAADDTDAVASSGSPVDRLAVGPVLPLKSPERVARILVVDDEPKLAQLLQSFLELQGHDVRTATSGAMALTLLAERSFDLLLTDLGMPEMSGWDVAREAQRLRPALPVIMVSGWGAEIDPQQVAESGVVEVIQKPYTFETIHQVIDKVLTQSPLSIPRG